jgi:general stress protein CsbA
MSDVRQLETILTIQEKLTQRVVEAGGKLSVKSALNPALWLCAIVSAPAIVASLSLGTNPPVWLITIACLPVVAATVGFLFLLLFDRDKLQSEDYQIRKQSLELIQEKGQEFAVNAASIELISNPEKPRLLSAKGEEE